MKVINFKYKSDYFFNIISALLFLILILVLIIIFKYFDNAAQRLLYTLLAFIVTNILLTVIGKYVSITTGRFSLDKHSFIYETLRNEYTISYQEIEYITKEKYIDNSSLIRKENYQYIVKIKNAGYFLFKYYDDSLLDALEELSYKSRAKIMDN